MIGSFAFLFIALLSGRPTDLVSFLEPQSALEALGESTDEANLKRLIDGKPGDPAGVAVTDEKTIRTALENLASSNDSVREKARADLASVGETARPRLEEVVKSDPKRAAEATAVLAGLDTAVKAAANRSRVSRLLAVRLAGDRKTAALAEPIRAAASSTGDSFLREAATEIIARIEGKDPPPPPDRPWTKSLVAIEALPKETNYVVDVPLAMALAGVPDALAPRIDRVLGPMAAMVGPGSDTLLAQATRGILDLVVKCGNFRADRLTLANVGALGRTKGLAIIIGGEYDPVLLENGIRSFGSWQIEDIGGKKALVSQFLRIVLIDEHHVILLPPDASDNFPIAEYVSAHAAGSKPLRGEARWAKFLGTLGSSARALILVASLIPPESVPGMESKLGPDAAAAIRGWKELDAEVKATDSKKLGVRVDAEFDEAKHASDLSAFVKGKITELIGDLEKQRAQIAGSPVEPMMKSALEILNSVQVTSEGKKGVLRGELDPSVLPPMLMGTAVHEKR